MSSQERIRLARRHAALSQSQLAQAVGVQRSAVSHWEAPQGKNPSVKHLRDVAVVTSSCAGPWSGPPLQSTRCVMAPRAWATCRCSSRWP